MFLYKVTFALWPATERITSQTTNQIQRTWLIGYAVPHGLPKETHVGTEIPRMNNVFRWLQDLQKHALPICKDARRTATCRESFI